MSGRQRKLYHHARCLCNDCLAEAYGYDWRDLVPGTGWLRDWVEYGLDVTDAPPIYHIASGLVALSTVVGNTCVFQPTPDDKPYMLNLWILTAGSSAKQRKSTSVSMVDELLSGPFSFLKVPWAGSPEALFSILSNQPQCVMIIPEFPSFLAQMNLKYAAPIKIMLMDLYDGKTAKRSTRSKGEEVITDPRLNLIGAGALDLLDKNLRDIDFRSGFLSRMFFIAGDRKKRLKRAQQDPKRLATLQNDLLQIAKWAGTIGVIQASKKADDALDNLCREIDERTNAADPSYQSLLARSELHAHKIAALYAASVRHKAVYESIVKTCVAPMIAHNIEVVETYLIRMMSDSEYVRAAHRILGHIREKGYEVGTDIPYRDLVQASLDIKHAEIGLAQLVAEDILKEMRVKDAEDQPSRIVYRLINQPKV